MTAPSALVLAIEVGVNYGRAAVGHHVRQLLDTRYPHLEGALTAAERDQLVARTLALLQRATITVTVPDGEHQSDALGHVVVLGDTILGPWPDPTGPAEYALFLGPDRNAQPGVIQPVPIPAGTQPLPGWEHMTDVDKGCALVHAVKCENEGDAYARGNYPARYLQDPRLKALPAGVACDHAVLVVGELEQLQDRIGDAEFDRLYDTALDAERRTHIT